MDFRNLCQKIDVDSIRAKLPPLPGLPTLPQIKLPKSVSKLKSRKIFRSSKEDVNRNSPEKGSQQQSLTIQHTQQQLSLPPAGFIKHTPTRISTISSLMNQESGEESTYRSACSIDDDYPPLSNYYGNSGTFLPPMSPICASTTATNLDNKNVSTTQGRMSLSERLHRSYKDLSEFRLKHIFAKKTVVRRDSIHVQHYVTRYEEDLRREAREQEQRDRAIAENYDFRFKTSRQNMDHSTSITPDDSPRSEPIVGRSTGRTVGELSGDESGMEASPPPRKPGIASSRFARVRNPPLRLSSSEQEDENIVHPEPNASTLWSMQKQQKQQQTSSQPSVEEQPTKSKFSYKESVRRLRSYVTTQEDHEASNEGAKGSTKMLSKLKGIGKRSETVDTDAKKNVKRKHETSPRSSDEEQSKPEVQTPNSPSRNALNAIKHNFKRLHQSMKSRSQQATTTDESADESTVQKRVTETKVEKLTSRLRRFRSRDVSVDDLDAEEEENPSAAKQQINQSPIRQVISHKLETWKKSFKKRQNKDVEGQTSDGETSPEKDKPTGHKRSDTLMKKLKHIRGRKSIGSKEDLEGNTEGEGTDETQKPKSRALKFTEARQRTFKKVNEKMQNMKFFHRSQEHSEPQEVTNKTKYNSEEEDLDESPTHEDEQSKSNLPPTITRRDFPPSREFSPERKSLDQESLEQVPLPTGTIHIPAARAAWSSKPYVSQSMESDIDPSELPRVLIHQDNSDSFESTLIIAVTRPILCTSPIITEIPPEEKVFTVPLKLESPRQEEWIPNKKIIADFIGSTPPSVSRHKRRLSMDSSSNSDSDSWMAESKGPKATTSRRTSQTGLGSIDEKNEAWKVKSTSDEVSQPLYKTKSIDIFEKNVLKGGALTAFEDFDEELRNEPVMKISAVQNPDSCDRDSSEDTADDDDSSRITKISVDRLREGSADSTKVISNSKEALRGKALLQYGNSRESLIANFDENEENQMSVKGKEEDEDEDEDYDSEDDDRPPSAAPSPPPKMSPPPPPLPQRQPSIRIPKKPSGTPPPLPKSKPPPISRKQGPPPPRIPDRTASMGRAPRPLVKTSSLRLVYSEQVKPADIGKVNKLISRFEPTDGPTTQRPRVISRRLPQDDSEDFSDDEEDYATMADKLKERYANIKIERDMTPTPTNTPNQNTPEAKKPLQNPESQNLKIQIKREIIVPMVVTTTDEDNNVQVLTQPMELKPTLEMPVDVNSNSRPNSEYGSPLEYPSSLTNSLETIPVIERRDANGQRLRSVERHNGRSRRSMTRDDDNFYSFDSDEENSYYSISSTSSNRYIVEL